MFFNPSSFFNPPKTFGGRMLNADLLRSRLQGIIKRIKISQLGRIWQIHNPVYDERHSLFGKPAMAAQRFFQGGQIMAMLGGANGHIFG